MIHRILWLSLLAGLYLGAEADKCSEPQERTACYAVKGCNWNKDPKEGEPRCMEDVHDCKALKFDDCKTDPNCRPVTTKYCHMGDAKEGRGKGKGDAKSCVGEWETCSKTCEDIKFIVTKEASKGGKDCNERGKTKKCTNGDGECVPIDCEGYFPECTKTCEDVAWVTTNEGNIRGKRCMNRDGKKTCSDGDGECRVTRIEYEKSFEYRYLDIEQTLVGVKDLVPLLITRMKNGVTVDIRNKPLEEKYVLASLATWKQDNGLERMAKGARVSLLTITPDETNKGKKRGEGFKYHVRLVIEPPGPSEETGWDKDGLKEYIIAHSQQMMREIDYYELEDSGLSQNDSWKVEDYGDKMVYDESKFSGPCRANQSKAQCSNNAEKDNCRWAYGIGCIPKDVMVCSDIGNPTTCQHTKGCKYDVFGGCITIREGVCEQYRTNWECAEKGASLKPDKICWWAGKAEGCTGRVKGKTYTCDINNEWKACKKAPGCQWDEENLICEPDDSKCEDWGNRRDCSKAPGCNWLDGKCLVIGEQPKCESYESQKNCQNAGKNQMQGCNWDWGQETCITNCNHPRDKAALDIFKGDTQAYQNHCESFNTRGQFDKKRGADSNKVECQANNCMWGSGRDLTDQTKKCVLPNACCIVANNPLVREDKFFKESRMNCCAVPSCQKKGMCVNNRQACLQPITDEIDEDFQTRVEPGVEWFTKEVFKYSPEGKEGVPKHTYGLLTLTGDEGWSRKYDKEGHWITTGIKMKGLPPGSQGHIMIRDGTCDNIGEPVWNKKARDTNPWEEWKWYAGNGNPEDTPEEFIKINQMGNNGESYSYKWQGWRPDDMLPFLDNWGKIVVVTTTPNDAYPHEKHLLCGKIILNKFGRFPCDVHWATAFENDKNKAAAEIEVYSAFMDQTYTISINRVELANMKKNIENGVRSSFFIQGIIPLDSGKYDKGGRLVVDILNVKEFRRRRAEFENRPRTVKMTWTEDEMSGDFHVNYEHDEGWDTHRRIESEGDDEPNEDGKFTYRTVITVYPTVDMEKVKAQSEAGEKVEIKIEPPSAEELNDMVSRASTSIKTTASELGIPIPEITDLTENENTSVEVPLYVGSAGGAASGDGAGSSTWVPPNKLAPGGTRYPTPAPTPEPIGDRPCTLHMLQATCEHNADKGCKWSNLIGCNTEVSGDEEPELQAGEQLMEIVTDQSDIVDYCGKEEFPIYQRFALYATELWSCAKNNVEECISCMRQAKPATDCKKPVAGMDEIISTLHNYIDNRSEELCNVVTKSCGGGHQLTATKLKAGDLDGCQKAPICDICVKARKPEQDCRIEEGSYYGFLDERANFLCNGVTAPTSAPVDRPPTMEPSPLPSRPPTSMPTPEPSRSPTSMPVCDAGGFELLPGLTIQQGFNNTEALVDYLISYGQMERPDADGFELLPGLTLQQGFNNTESLVDYLISHGQMELPETTPAPIPAPTTQEESSEDEWEKFIDGQTKDLKFKTLLDYNIFLERYDGDKHDCHMAGGKYQNGKCKSIKATKCKDIHDTEICNATGCKAKCTGKFKLAPGN